MAATNPLFPQQPANDDDTNDRGGYVLPRSPYGVTQTQAINPNNPAADLVRQKLDQIYADEPNSKQEFAEAEAARPRSKHQAYMHELNHSGKPLADIQVAWHEYYAGLPDNEKHEVWREFYASANQSAAGQYIAQQRAASQAVVTEQQQLEPATGQVTHNPTTGAVIGNHEPAAATSATKHRKPKPRIKDIRSVADVKRQLLHTVTAGGQLKARHHLQSLAFGLGTGFIVLFIFLFTFFNEVFITPFIQPNSKASATPVIVDPASVQANATPEVIIPKINVEIPTDYTQTTTNEAQIENALESGIVHYPTTVLPGQQGNAAYFGHSSNNIFNPGKYKFAFVLLHEIVPGDTFYLTNNGTVYAYKVISRTIVDPSDVGVLGPVAGQTATATLITCDPPGTSLKRLIVVGQQVSPDPSGNTVAAGTPDTADTQSPQSLPGNGPSFASRIWHSIF
jgi:LPXTG-site transpeptidase (sortase) family protein